MKRNAYIIEILPSPLCLFKSQSGWLGIDFEGCPVAGRDSDPHGVAQLDGLPSQEQWEQLATEFGKGLYIDPDLLPHPYRLRLVAEEIIGDEIYYVGKDWVAVKDLGQRQTKIILVPLRISDLFLLHEKGFQRADVFKGMYRHPKFGENISLNRALHLAHELYIPFIKR